MGGIFGGAPKVETVAATPPPAPPSEEAQLEEFTDEETERRKRETKTQGTQALQIPLGGTTTGTATVGQL